MLSRLPTRCKHCKAKFSAEERARALTLHADCVDGWLAVNLPKLEKKRVQVAKKRAAEGRAVLRARKAALKRIPDLIAEAQKEFNAAIRERDKDKGCISCGRTLRFSDGDGTGGHFDCGHFRSTGSAPHLRFDERNAHGQCKHCNRYLAGNVVEYRKRLALRLGLAAVEALEADNRIHKWQRDELIAIKETYKQRRKELEKQA